MRKSPWIDCLFYKDNEVHAGQVLKDGLLIRMTSEVFSRFKTGPCVKGKYYFNNALDREIAEKDGDWYVANPQLVWQNGFEIMS